MPATIRLPSVGMSRGSGPATELKVRKIQLGDGYVQAVADGIHNVRRRYRCVWRGIPKADAETLRAFLAARGGHEPFLSPDSDRPPDMDASTQWRCERFSGPTWVSASLRDMEAELVEDFSP